MGSGSSSFSGGDSVKTKTNRRYRLRGRRHCRQHHKITRLVGSSSDRISSTLIETAFGDLHEAVIAEDAV